MEMRVIYFLFFKHCFVKEAGERQEQAMTQENFIERLVRRLEAGEPRAVVEKILQKTFATAPDTLETAEESYFSAFSEHLYRFILQHYKHGREGCCFWRFIKILSPKQLKNPPPEELRMIDRLVRIYFHSEPLDDLTCLFIPVESPHLINDYLGWIKRYFYDADYPTSLLWLYALDSSLASLFPAEMTFMGIRRPGSDPDILIPDFYATESVLIKRYSLDGSRYGVLEGKAANYEFRQFFAFLRREHRDRCLSRSGRKEEYSDQAAYKMEWEKFNDVLKYGVSDKNEVGCISFSDLRASTRFLTTYGKNVYLNKIQQPFFEQTRLISRKYSGRIDKFMGDNVMCVFIDHFLSSQESEGMVARNFCSLFELCRVLNGLIEASGLTGADLGLRSGATYGDQILRSNLGNEIVRDFTVTGETVNLAARLEHITIHELILHNSSYFEKAIERFPKICDLLSIGQCSNNLNPETQAVVDNFTLYQNVHSNLEHLSRARFDIRCNETYYRMLKAHLIQRGFTHHNPEKAQTFGYEEMVSEGFDLKFYLSYYNPKGFTGYERIWILPLEPDLLKGLDVGKIT